MKLAYLTAQYPKVSHTFIRREIAELERRGHRILRLAIRSPENQVVEPADLEEAAKTHCCLCESPLTLLGATVRLTIARPLALARALLLAVRVGARSERGWLRHLAYLVEACFFLGLVTREGVEHVHVHFGTNAACVALLMRRLGGPPFSVTVHGPAEFDAPRGLSLGEKVMAAEFTVAVSSFGSAQIRRWIEHEHWPRVHVVHCSVDRRFFEERTEIAESCRTLVSVGRLTAQKGPLLLIDAMSELVSAGIDARLVLAGDGEMRTSVEKRIREASLGSRVEITGWIDEAEVRRRLREARCLVLPSFSEGLPVVIMEALAMGRPVISTCIAGIPELVRHGENGWLVPAGDRESLVRVMREACLASPERLNRMGEVGRRLAQCKHSVETEVAKLETLMLDAVSRRPR